MATGHAKVQAHTRAKPSGGTTQVRQHGRRVPLVCEHLTNARGRVDRDRLATAGKALGASAGMAGIGVLHAAVDLTWAAATVVSVACTVVIWCGGQLAASGHAKRKARRGPRKRRTPAALRYGKRARLAHYRWRQWRHRRGKGTWGQRMAMQTRSRRRKAGKQ